MSWVVRLRTALIGKLVDLYGWSAGLYAADRCGIGHRLCLSHAHLGTLELEAKKESAENDADDFGNGLGLAGAKPDLMRSEPGVMAKHNVLPRARFVYTVEIERVNSSCCVTPKS